MSNDPFDPVIGTFSFPEVFLGRRPKRWGGTNHKPCISGQMLRKPGNLKGHSYTSSDLKQGVQRDLRFHKYSYDFYVPGKANNSRS